MAKRQSTGNARYLVTNSLQASFILIIAVIGVAGLVIGAFNAGMNILRSVGPAIGVLFGLMMLSRGADMANETSTGVVGATLFIGLLLLGGDLTVFILDVLDLLGRGLLEAKWFTPLISFFAHLYIAHVGLNQRKKTKETYCNGTKYEKRQPLLVKTIIYGLLLGGLLSAVADALNFITAFISASKVFSTVISALGIIGTASSYIGAMSWLFYTIFVGKSLRRTGRTINNCNRNSGSSSASSAPVQTSSSANGADLDKVRREMESLATYFTGGTDTPYHDCLITYSVSASVHKGTIDFVLSCDLSGSYDPSKEDAVMSSVTSKIKKRQQLILDRASERLEKINPTDDYHLTVSLKVV